jgi:hypothetical protein
MNVCRRVLASRKVTIPPITLSSVESDSKDPSVEGHFEEHMHQQEKEARGLVNRSPAGISAPISLSGRFWCFFPLWTTGGHPPL